MQQENVEVLLWPVYFSDLSPIEHLWHQLGRRLTDRNPKPGNMQQLVDALQEEWANIPQDSIRRLILSMRRRCTSCVQAHGGHILYWQLCDFHIWYHYHVTAIDDSYCAYSLLFALECLVCYQMHTCVAYPAHGGIKGDWYSLMVYSTKQSLQSLVPQSVGRESIPMRMHLSHS